MGLYHIEYSWRYKFEFYEVCDYINTVLRNPFAVSNLYILFRKKQSILQIYPYSFPIFNSYSKSKRYFIIKNYTFIYSINEFSKTVYLERCLYSKSDLNNK